MKYKFYTIEQEQFSPFPPRKIPVIELEEAEKYGDLFVEEITNLASDMDYLRDLVQKLEQVLSGKLNEHIFGYNEYLMTATPSDTKVADTYDSSYIEATIPTSEVYELIRDWEKYLLRVR